MHVVRRTDDYGVDLAVHLGEHPAIVAVLGRCGELLKRFGSTTLVDIAQRDNILGGHLGQILRAPAAGTDERDVELLNA
jgi:hypothetical protein